MVGLSTKGEYISIRQTFLAGAATSNIMNQISEHISIISLALCCYQAFETSPNNGVMTEQARLLRKYFRHGRSSLELESTCTNMKSHPETDTSFHPICRKADTCHPKSKRTITYSDLIVTSWAHSYNSCHPTCHCRHVLPSNPHMSSPTMSYHS